MNWEHIDEVVRERALLRHPFYQAWSRGALSLGDLREYAKQYYFLESGFPRFLSRVHSHTEDTEARRVLLENLMDEEKGPENHRELWLRFCEGLGLSREEVLAARPSASTRACVDAFMSLADRGPVEGLSALYAYESQVPEVALSKIDGLKAFYGISDERSLGFFTTHAEADRWHSAQERLALEALGADGERVASAARYAAEALWGFLDGVENARRAAGATPACAACPA